MPDPARIKLLIFDVDGVLTDGALYYGPGDVELKRFNIKDGLGIRAAMRAGLRIGVLTARKSDTVTRRCTELQIEHVIQGSPDKSRDVRRLATATGFDLEETAFLGDDLVDLPALGLVGYPMAVADAVAEVRDCAAFVTTALGGHGAAREAVEHLLKAQGKWDSIVARYTG